MYLPEEDLPDAVKEDSLIKTDGIAYNKDEEDSSKMKISLIYSSNV
jgi:hypothetical protein